MQAGKRRAGRELALKVLYALRDQRNPDPEQLLADFWASFRFADDELGETLEEPGPAVHPAVRCFAEDLVRGVIGHLPAIDETLSRASTNWALERMARVDLALLRLAVYELLLHPETPASVVINEAIEIGKRYGTRETPAFLNGILDRIAKKESAASSQDP